jgi:hypothetical protein
MERRKERIKKYTLGSSHTAASPAIETRMRKSLAVCRCRLLTVLCLLFWYTRTVRVWTTPWLTRAPSLPEPSVVGLFRPIKAESSRLSPTSRHQPTSPKPPQLQFVCFTIKMPPTRPTGFACTTCGREYQHSSHLRRHEATRKCIHSEKTPSRDLPGVTVLPPSAQLTMGLVRFGV